KILLLVYHVFGRMELFFHWADLLLFPALYISPSLTPHIHRCPDTPSARHPRQVHSPVLLPARRSPPRLHGNRRRDQVCFPQPRAFSAASSARSMPRRRQYRPAPEAPA